MSNLSSSPTRRRPPPRSFERNGKHRKNDHIMNDRIKDNENSQRKSISPLHRILIVVFLGLSPTIWKYLNQMMNRKNNFGGRQRSSYDKYSSTGAEKYVTCGSAIKLTHDLSGHVLSSQTGTNWSGRGSGQQVVTGSPDLGNHSSLWLVQNGNNCAVTEPIKCNSNINLSHLLSNKNLHSHMNYPSQMSGGNEVTARSGEINSVGDWIVQCEDGLQFWERNRRVKLMHSHTLTYLSAHPKYEFNRNNCGMNCPVQNHIEVYGDRKQGKEALWLATLGIHLST